MKKVVHYRPSTRDEIVVGFPAWVYPTDHPGPYVSNTKLVRTSNVVRIGESGEFETENTIYRRL